ncbi:Gelsolin domain-containing protein [Cynara cardunculus var. scolymus]|uniref:Gelsolin domain-containing protein n=1 Tax=Cynara cardunculus var. scolymus TaxID=59895 RepID=A0A103XQ74_CYNCS|nr:Gelsolin domain-containing protein [Cynara cardunculus var. scolymus]
MELVAQTTAAPVQSAPQQERVQAIIYAFELFAELRSCALEDQKVAHQLATSMSNSLKGRAVQGRVYQGKEPPQFVAIFQPMVVLKGGLSSGYKSYIADKGLTDNTYRPDATALIEISGTSAHTNKALQVEAVATSLNSYGCFVVQSGSAVFTWYGNQSTVEQQQLAAKVVECLKSRVPVKFVKEGKESLAFWLALGGKRDYTSKKVTQEIVKEPHLFAVSLNKGFKSIEEVYNYDQDDLLPEDVMILETHAEVFVWVGQSVDPKEKQSAFEIGQKYIELAASLEGLSPYVPLYRILEGSEPCFFTTYFSWDPTKATVSGNSFTKKATLLFGAGSVENQDKSHGTKSGGATQRASAMAALTNAFRSSSVTKTPTSPRMPTRGSQRAAAVAALSNVLTAEKKGQPESPTRRQHKRNPSSEPGSPAGFHKRYPSSEPGSPSGTQTLLWLDACKLNIKMYKELPMGLCAAPFKSEEASTFFVNNESSQVITEPIPETNEEESSMKQTTEDSSTKQTTEDSSTKQIHEQEEGGGVDIQTSYSYEQLNTKSKNPITGIDYKKREAYLSPEEFEAIFKMTKEAFYQLPRWKQDQNKKKVDLF